MVTSTPNYAVFLRGINVGKRQVQMTKLKSAFEKMGYKEVRTVLATGNVVFYADTSDKKQLAVDIEHSLEQFFGFSVKVIVRSIDEINALIAQNPFKGIRETPDTRLYVTFLSEPHKSSLSIPYISPEKEFTILKVSDTEVISVLVLGKDTRTVEAMAIIEKEFGKNVTTRNWNTLLKSVSK